jgi:outer membrane protein TolC
MEAHLREANDYFKAGMVPKLDVIRAEVKLSDLKQKLTMATNGRDLAKKALNFTLGVDLATDYPIDTSASLVSFSQSLEDCVKVALKDRPELAAMDMKISMAEENIEIAKSAQRPLVGLQIKGEDTHPYNSEPSVSINLGASLSIFDGGMVKNKKAEAEDLLQQVKTGKELITRGILLDVEQAYRNLLSAKEAVEVAQTSIEQAKEASRMAEVSYKAGLCTSLEKIDAEVALTQAESNYTQALSLYNITFAQLQKAMGIEEGVFQ